MTGQNPGQQTSQNPGFSNMPSMQGPQGMQGGMGMFAPFLQAMMGNVGGQQQFGMPQSQQTFGMGPQMQQQQPQQQPWSSPNALQWQHPYGNQPQPPMGTFGPAMPGVANGIGGNALQAKLLSILGPNSSGTPLPTSNFYE